MITSVSEFVDKALDLTSGFGGKDGPWYRGMDDSGHSLLPGLYRQPGMREWEIVTDFKSQAHLYADSGFRLRFNSAEDCWEWYFLARHFGLPTRLLDWTENPLVGLYFAVQSGGGCKSPCVWALDPNRLNRLSVEDDEVLVPTGQFSQRWLCKESPEVDVGCEPGRTVTFEFGGKTYTNEHPLAIYPIRSNPRIVAQQGVFTVHGSNAIGLGELVQAKLPTEASQVFGSVTTPLFRKVLGALHRSGESLVALAFYHEGGLGVSTIHE